MRNKIYLALIFIFLNTTNLFSQKIDRIEIGLGIGTNTFSWSVLDTFNKNTAEILRNKVDIIPVVRLSVLKDFLVKKRYVLGIQPFLGYYTFGGSSKTENNGYKDKIRFNSIELGLTPYLRIKDFQIGVGLKGQYVLKTISKSFGYINKGTTDSTIWKHYDMTNLFKQTAFNLGLNLKYVKPKYSIGLEHWYGLTNLNKTIPKEFKPMMRESNTRLIFSYNLKSFKKSGKKISINKELEGSQHITRADK